MVSGSDRRLSAEISDVLPQIAVDLTSLTVEVRGEVCTAGTLAALRADLARLIYRRFHQGLAENGHADAESARDRRFEQQAADLVPHEFRQSRAVPMKSEGGSMLVGVNGVRVWVPKAHVYDEGVGSGADDIGVLLPAARPMLSPGYLLVDSSRQQAWTSEDPVLRVYVGLSDTDTALLTWRKILRDLENENFGYRAKLLVRAKNYPQRDAIVVYLRPEAKGALPVVRRAVSSAGGASERTSPFARQVAAGVAIAWEPDGGQVRSRRLSFGEHRSRAVADGIVDHALQATHPLSDIVASALVAANIDPSEPYRNLNSPELDQSFLDGASCPCPGCQ